jgi:hypothetical protein
LAINRDMGDSESLTQRATTGHAGCMDEGRVLQEVAGKKDKGPTWKRIKNQGKSQQVEKLGVKRPMFENCDPNVVFSAKTKRVKHAADYGQEGTIFAMATDGQQPGQLQ